MAKETTKKNRQAKKKAAYKASAKKTISNNKLQAQDTKVLAATEQAEPKQVVAVEETTFVIEEPSIAANPLKKWNIWLAILYALQGLAVVLVGAKVTAPLIVQYPAIDTLASEASGEQVISAAGRHLANVNIAWAVAIFLIVFAATRFVMSGFMRTTATVATASRGISNLRWVGFGLGGAIMISVIALLSGIYQISSLILMMLSMFVGCMLMFGAEMLADINKGAKTRFSKLLFCVATTWIVAPWVIFAMTVAGALAWGGHIEGYMYSVYACTGLLFLAILLAAHFRLTRKGKWADAAYTERSYAVLEFLLATLLAWQIFVGILR